MKKKISKRKKQVTILYSLGMIALTVMVTLSDSATTIGLSLLSAVFTSSAIIIAEEKN